VDFHLLLFAGFHRRTRYLVCGYSDQAPMPL
jgi:hypothetical protein